MSPWKNRVLEQYLDKINSDDDIYNPRITYHLSVPYHEKYRSAIFDNERHVMDTSVETLRLLNIIIYNTDKFIGGRLSVNGIIAIGKYLRNEGDKVDYVKLDGWLARLRIRHIASYLSSVLLYVFRFEAAELPFLYRNCPEAQHTLRRQLEAPKAHSTLGGIGNLARYSLTLSAGLLLTKIHNSLNSIEE